MEISSSEGGEPKGIRKELYVNVTPVQEIFTTPVYKVFICYRGRDVRNSLASFLYEELCCSGVNVFRDDQNGEMTDFLPNYVQKVICNASLHIPILSKIFVNSPQCLDELSFMLKTGNTILPVFYDIQPSDIQLIVKEERIYSKIFAQYEMNPRFDHQRILEWKEALFIVSSLSTGRVFNSLDFDQQRRKKDIVNTVLKFMENEGFSKDGHPVLNFMKNEWISKDGHPVRLDDETQDIEKTVDGDLYWNYKDYWESKLVMSSGILFKDVKQSPKVVVIKGREGENPTAEALLLRWYNCPHTSIPPSFSVENLRVLELINVFFNELWNCNAKPPTQLRKLNILGSIAKFPKSIGQLEHLEIIVVDGWLNTSLKALPEEFCDLRSLKRLSLRWCRELKSLPTHFGNLTELQHLNLSFCSDLRALTQSFKKLIQLEYVDFQSCRNLEIEPYFLGQICTLKYLSLKDCKELRVFPTQVPCQKYLKSLNMVGTNLQEVPTEVGRLINLEVLELGSPYLTDLPVSLGNLSKLQTLALQGCSSLTCLPDSLSMLKHLTINAPEELKKARGEDNSREKYSTITKTKIFKPASYFNNILLEGFKFKSS